EPFCRPARDVVHLAGEDQAAVLGLQDGVDGIAMRPTGGLDDLAERIALVVVLRMAHSFTSLPVRGALHVPAMEPTATQAVRESRSIHFHVAARGTTTPLSRTSASVSGQGRRSWIANDVIWASGNARPIASASTTGLPSRAAAMNGWMALPPPISTDITARNVRPRYSSIIVTARAMV